MLEINETKSNNNKLNPKKLETIRTHDQKLNKKDETTPIQT